MEAILREKARLAEDNACLRREGRTLAKQMEILGMMQGESPAAANPLTGAAVTKKDKKRRHMGRGEADGGGDGASAGRDAASETSEPPAGPEDDGGKESGGSCKIEVESVSTGSLGTSASFSSSQACEEDFAKAARSEDSERAGSGSGTDSGEGQGQAPAFLQTIAGGPSPQATAKVTSENHSDNEDADAKEECDGGSDDEDGDDGGGAGAKEGERGEEGVRRKEGSSVKIRAEDLFGIIQNTPSKSPKPPVDATANAAGDGFESPEKEGKEEEEEGEDQQANRGRDSRGDTFSSKDKADACRVFEDVWNALDDEEEARSGSGQAEDDDDDDDEQRWFDLQDEWQRVKDFCDSHRDIIKPPFREKRPLHETAKPVPGLANGGGAKDSILDITNISQSVKAIDHKALQRDWFGVVRAACKEDATCAGFQPAFHGCPPPQCLFERAISEGRNDLMERALQVCVCERERERAHARKHTSTLCIACFPYSRLSLVSLTEKKCGRKCVPDV